MLRRHLIRAGLIAAALPLAAAPSGAVWAQDLPRNLRMVIGSSSTGGDTYQNSAILAEALSEHLGINVKVDATGASEAFKALERDASGNTVMMFHDQAYLGDLYGVTGYDDPFEGYRIGPTVAINPGNAYLVPKDSPYETMADIVAAAGAGERVRVAIQPGGVSEIGFSALKNAVRIEHPGSEDNIAAVNTGSQSDKDQLLFDDQADLINGSVQANEQFTQLEEDDRRAMRFVWLTARPETLEQAPEAGMGATDRAALLSHASPEVSVTQDGTSDFTFDKEFFLLYNSEMDEAIVEAIDTALAEIFEQGSIQQTQTGSFFIPNFRPSGEAEAYLRDKRDQYRQVIDAITEGS